MAVIATAAVVWVMLLFGGTPSAHASHNRASQLSWELGDSATEAVFAVHFVARASYYGSPTTGGTFTDPILDFGDGTSVAPELTVTAVDETNDIVYAEAEDIAHEYSSTGPWTAEFSSCCRLSGPAHINNPDGEYAVRALVDLGATTASPVSSFAPIVECQVDATCVFRIAANDPDSQALSWRLATPDDAPGFNQPGPPFAPNTATVNASTGVFTWDTSGATLSSDPDGPTFYSAQVVVENTEAGQVTSRIAVDFLIKIIAGPGTNGSCRDIDGDGDPDDDGDGLCDNWEREGIDVDDDGVIDLQLYDSNGDGVFTAAELADPNVPDVFVEIDYMAGRQPSAAALDRVVAAFAAAPEPVRLHYVLATGPIPFTNDIALQSCAAPCPSDVVRFDDVKNSYFGTPTERGTPAVTAKRLAFHYVVFANGLYLTNSNGSRAVGNSTSGQSELPGNDSVVTLGRWPTPGGTPAQQAGTFMHELGHSLGLRHGGGDDVNCKPNYLSVMSYTRQTYQLGASRSLDYSRDELLLLDESSLDEQYGIGGPTSEETVYGPARRVVPADGPINWNQSGFLGFFEIESGRVQADVNRVNPPNATGCGGVGTRLTGYDDWANLVLDFRASPDFADGVHSTVEQQEPELSADIAAATEDTDADGIPDLDDNCWRQPNADQADVNQDGIGDACLDGATPGSPPQSSPSSPSTPGASSSVSPSGSGAAVPESTQSPSAGTGTGRDELARTGAPVGALVVLATVLLVCGAATGLAARARRP